MATEVQTGMDRAEMKRLLIKSKQEPVNCALGVGDDKSVALLMLSPHRSAKSLQGDLQKQFATAFNTRFGTAVVDTDDDPTLVKFMLNKAVTSMARRLVKTLKGTGFRKVQILLEDGSPVENAVEEDGAEPTTMDAAVTAVLPTPPQVTPMPDATVLAAALTELVKRIPETEDPTRRETLAKQAREANANIKIGNLAYAAAGIESLRRALAEPRESRSRSVADGEIPSPTPTEAELRGAAARVPAEVQAAAVAMPRATAGLAAGISALQVQLVERDLAAAHATLRKLAAVVDAVLPVEQPGANLASQTPKDEAIQRWQASRAVVVTQLRGILAQVDTSDHPGAAVASIRLRSVIRTLARDPVTLREANELDRWLSSDDIVGKVEMTNGFGIVVHLRAPLLDALRNLMQFLGD
jgi:hypothetical protein